MKSPLKLSLKILNWADDLAAEAYYNRFELIRFEFSKFRVLEIFHFSGC